MIKDYEKFEKNISILVKTISNKLSNFMSTVKNTIIVFKPFFEEYGYDMKYLNKVIYIAKYSKKKRVRNKYKNMLRRTLGEEKLNKLLED